MFLLWEKFKRQINLTHLSSYVYALHATCIKNRIMRNERVTRLRFRGLIAAVALALQVQWHSFTLANQETEFLFFFSFSSPFEFLFKRLIKYSSTFKKVQFSHSNLFIYNSNFHKWNYHYFQLLKYFIQFIIFKLINYYSFRF